MKDEYDFSKMKGRKNPFVGRKKRVRKYILDVQQSPNGFSVWASSGNDRRWVLDASTIYSDGTFRFSPERFKLIKDSPTYREFKLKNRRP